MDVQNLSKIRTDCEDNMISVRLTNRNQKMCQALKIQVTKSHYVMKQFIVQKINTHQE